MRLINPKTISCLLAVLSLAVSVLSHAGELQMERLTWAGVKLQMDDTTVFIDAVGTDLWDGNAPEGLVAVTADTGRRYALVTHTHNDHFDLATLREVLGERGYVICHESMASHLASRGLRVIPVQSYVPVSRGGFIFMAVPAQDGFGSEQVSWIV
jgi:L-ascorbate metabolism protein UlaG (beta-lactamase superfamily)